MYSLMGLIILVLDIIAIVSILKSGADTGTKILWVLLVILLPVVGMVLYFLMGPGPPGRRLRREASEPGRRVVSRDRPALRERRLLGDRPGSQPRHGAPGRRPEGLALRGRRALDADAGPREGRHGHGTRARSYPLRSVLGDSRAAPRDSREGPHKNGIPCDDEAPVVVNGGMQGLFAAFSTLLDAGDEVLLFSPYWTPIVDLIGYHRATPALVPTVEARRQGIPRRSPRKPPRRQSSSTGIRRATRPGDVFSRAETEEVAAFARERGLAVISDEAYEDLVYEGEPSVAMASLPGMSERTISCFTLSKSYSMTGWRLGYVIPPKRYQAAIQTVVLYTTNGVSTPTQWAGVEALARGTEFVAEWHGGLPLPARPIVEGLKVGGLRDRAPAGGSLPLPETAGLAAVRLARGRARPARRGQDRDRARHRVRCGGRRPPPLLVLRLRGDDRRRRRGPLGIRERERLLRALLASRVRSALRIAAFAPSCSPRRSPVTADRFDDAYAQAQAKLATPEGQAYAASVAARFDEKKLRDALLECAENVPPEDNPPFTVLMEMTADGRPTQVLLRPPAPVAVCLRWVIRESSFPRAPAPGYWVSVDLSATRAAGRPGHPDARRRDGDRSADPDARAAASSPAAPHTLPTPTPSARVEIFATEGIHVDSRKPDLAIAPPYSVGVARRDRPAPRAKRRRGARRREARAVLVPCRRARPADRDHPRPGARGAGIEPELPIALGDPLRLESVLVRHPKLRIVVVRRRLAVRRRDGGTDVALSAGLRRHPATHAGPAGRRSPGVRPAARRRGIRGADLIGRRYRHRGHN